MSRVRNIACSFVFVALLTSNEATSADCLKNRTFTPEPAIQKAIDDFVKKTTTEEDFETYLAPLRKSSRKHMQKFVQNLVYYGSRGRSLREGMAPAVIQQYLQISDAQIVGALLPYIGTKDDRFRKELETAITELDPGFRGSPARFKYINLRQYSLKGGPPPNLVKFIYKKRPALSLHLMVAHYLPYSSLKRKKPIYWAEYSVRHAMALKQLQFDEKYPKAEREAIAALEKASKHKEWWVRLYVAEILSKHSQFRTKEMVERLKRDKHELVRGAVSRNPVK